MNRIIPVTVLSCLHTALFNPPPRKGDKVYCAKCDDYKEATTAPRDIRVDCKMCVYAKDYGDAELTANTKASAHALRRPGHRVVVTDGVRVIGEHYAEPMRMEAPNF